MVQRFVRYELLTTAPEAAARFYAELLGAALRAEGTGFELAAERETIASVSLLPQQAVARGAPSHWRGHLVAADLDRTVETLLSRGAERRGPPRRLPRGGNVVPLRDPFGAVLALTDESSAPAAGSPVWHELHTTDHTGAAQLYAELFGWELREPINGEAPSDECHVFGWDATTPPCGAILSTARMPGIHPHWLYYFQVADLTRALAHVTRSGGRVVTATERRGVDMAYCEDPHGAAFALQLTPR